MRPYCKLPLTPALVALGEQAEQAVVVPAVLREIVLPMAPFPAAGLAESEPAAVLAALELRWVAAEARDVRRLSALLHQARRAEEIRSEAPSHLAAEARAEASAARVSLYSSRASSTSSACSETFTLGKMCVIFPSSPMMNVVRSIPIYFFPYMDFSFQTS